MMAPDADMACAHKYRPWPTAWDPDAAATVTLRYASGDGYNDPSAPGYYEPRIVQAGNFVRRLQGQPPGLAGGGSGGGELVLADPDGGLDALASYAFDGRTFALLVGDQDAAYAAFEIVLSGTVEQAEVDFRRVVLRLRAGEAAPRTEAGMHAHNVTTLIRTTPG